MIRWIRMVNGTIGEIHMGNLEKTMDIVNNIDILSQPMFNSVEEYMHYNWDIKTEGDNLIDVLEVGDIVIINKFQNQRVVIEEITTTYISSGEGYYQWFLEGKDIAKVITHEQYMPLAQEVINE